MRDGGSGLLKRRRTPTITPEQARLDLVRRHGARARQVTSDSDATTDPIGVSATYFLLRRGLAALAIAYPVVLIGLGQLLNGRIEHSLSAYYHAADPDLAVAALGRLRDIFVGVLCAIGAFLILYRGYSWQEDWALDVAGAAAILVALFPMDWPEHLLTRTPRGYTHYASAAVFFVAIAYVCMFRARDTLPILQDAERRRRYLERYRVLGVLMFAVPASVTIVNLMNRNLLKGYAPLLIEVAGVWVFSIFWLIKSREILEIECE